MCNTRARAWDLSIHFLCLFTKRIWSTTFVNRNQIEFHYMCESISLVSVWWAQSHHSESPIELIIIIDSRHI